VVISGVWKANVGEKQQENMKFSPKEKVVDLSMVEIWSGHRKEGQKLGKENRFGPLGSS